MAEKIEAPRTFATAKQSVVIRPKAPNTLAFVYHGFTDLKNLVKFVGSRPTIDENGDLYFRKNLIKDNSVILRDAFGKVIEVLNYNDASAKYEIVGDSEFKAEHANKVETKSRLNEDARGTAEVKTKK
jgi:hypothetical protein